MYDLKIAAIQSDIIWENIDANLTLFGDKIDSIKDEIDLIVLPEMFTTGFSMNTSLAEEMTGKTVKWILEKAKTKKCCILGSVMIKEKEKFQVIADGNTYDLLTAAVTHFKAEIGDNISVIIPAWKAATFAAIDMVLPTK